MQAGWGTRKCKDKSHRTPKSGDGVRVRACQSETKTAQGVTYTYDGLGNRVEKSNGTLYWYGPGGEVLDETNLTGSLTNEYVFFAGKRVARRDASGNIYYYAEDFIGSSRVITQSNGTLCSDADFLPFGQEVDYTSACGQNYKFEGKEWDIETGNDNFGARYYRSALGRWMSPDWSAIPAPVPYANLTNPQTLNLYAMTSDNPETFADLDGHTEAIEATNGSPGGFDIQGIAIDVDMAGLMQIEEYLAESQPTTNQSNQPAPPPQSPNDVKAQQQIAAGYIPAGGVEALGVTAGRINNETNGMKDSKNENMSLSDAEKLMAHARFGAEREYGKNVQKLSSMMDPLMSGPGYKRALAATIAAAREDLKGIDFDPTHGAIHYNMRTLGQAAGMGEFLGTRVSTVSGPYISPSKFKYIVTYSNNYGPWP